MSIARIASSTYVVGLAADTVPSQPWSWSRGRNVGARKMSGKKTNTAVWAPAALPASRPVATE
jgi:hypothetical protein